MTPPEQQVIALILDGHNTASVAEQLEISPDTVKLHRKNSYARLRVNSQRELFYKFLGELGFRPND